MNWVAAWKATRFVALFIAAIAAGLALIVFLEPRDFLIIVGASFLSIFWYAIYCGYKRDLRR